MAIMNRLELKGKKPMKKVQVMNLYLIDKEEKFLMTKDMSLPQRTLVNTDGTFKGVLDVNNDYFSHPYVTKHFTKLINYYSPLEGDVVCYLVWLERSQMQHQVIPLDEYNYRDLFKIAADVPDRKVSKFLLELIEFWDRREASRNHDKISKLAKSMKDRFDNTTKKDSQDE